jgi:phthalate 4,5-dioxygenase oxygenase subunit
MLSAESNMLVTRIEGGAPMGALMSENYWIPALISSQLVADGAPQRVRLLGKDYVAFRASDGRIGFFDEACPHRGTSLVLARNEDCALTCIFHGWKIDVSGTVVDVPTHTPNAAEFAARVRVNHYPVHEGGKIIWVWLGKDEAPAFPELPFTIVSDGQVWITYTKLYSNWLQSVEATLDTVHVGTLHSSYIGRQLGKPATITNALDTLAARYEVERTAYGLDAKALRPLGDGSTYLRTTKWLMPFISLVPGNAEVPGVIFITVPVDDTHSALIYGCWTPGEDIVGPDKEIPDTQIFGIGDRPYDPHNFGGFSGSRDENWGQDRDAMKNGHFTGFMGNLIQEDTVTQASMGAITDRTKEHLSSSDVAIVSARRLLLDSIKAMAAGDPVPGAGNNLDFSDVNPIDEVLPPAAQELATAGTR